MANPRENYSLSSSFDEDRASIVSRDSAFCEEPTKGNSKQCIEILNKVAVAISEIGNYCEQPTKVCKQLNVILDFYYDKPKYRKEIAEVLWQCGYSSYTCNMYRTIKTKDPFSSGILGKLWDVKKTLRLIVHILWNYSGYSKHFSEALVEYDLIEDMCDFLTQAHNSPKEMMKNRDKEHMVMATISVLRNIATHKSTLKTFHDMDVYTLVKRYSHIDKKEIKLITYTTMALVANKEQAQEVTAESDTFKYLVRLMAYAVGRDDVHRIKERYMSSDLVLYLSKMTIDGNIGAVINTNILDTFFKMLKSPNTLERYRTSECLYNLSFDPKGREAIKNHDLYLCLKPIEKLEKDSDVRKNINCLLENLDPKSEPPTKLLTKTRHILINYNNDDVEMVKKIVDRITAAGIEIWIDFKLEHSDILGAISEAVAESSVVVVCVSEPFRQDPWCRGLALQAIQHKKTFIPLCMQYNYKPDGWLELILPNERKYIDFSTGADFELSFNMFLQELKKPELSMGAMKTALDAISDSRDGFIKDPEAAVFGEIKRESVHMETNLYHTEAVSPQFFSNPIPDHMDKMDKEKVKRWFINNDLSKLFQKMKGIDGKKLWELQCMKIQNREFYDSFLEGEYGLVDGELLNFDTALSNLVRLCNYV